MKRLARAAFGYRGWQQFTQLHVRAYRASRGRLGKTYKGAPVLLLDHVGRKSGRHMTSPLIYGEDGKDLVWSRRSAARRATRSGGRT